MPSAQNTGFDKNRRGCHHRMPALHSPFWGGMDHKDKFSRSLASLGSYTTEHNMGSSSSICQPASINNWPRETVLDMLITSSPACCALSSVNLRTLTFPGGQRKMLSSSISVNRARARLTIISDEKNKFRSQPIAPFIFICLFIYLFISLNQNGYVCVWFSIPCQQFCEDWNFFCTGRMCLW